MHVYFHEWTHGADKHLLSRWIQANERKINEGRTPDALFLDNVRIASVNGRFTVQLHDGFINAFLEARAYEVGELADQITRGNGAFLTRFLLRQAICPTFRASSVLKGST